MSLFGFVIIPDADLKEAQVLHQKHKEWLERRGIKSDIAEKMEVTTTTDSVGNWLTFPYRVRGKLVNRKYRLTSEKQHRQDKGGKMVLWNNEVLQSDYVERGGSVIITEGEFDAMVAMQCGLPGVVSVPNGAPQESIESPENANRYSFLWESVGSLEKVKKFILATDGDAPGIALARDLASILGPERCCFIQYPDGQKDLNEVYLASGQSGLVQLVNAAKPFPVKGLHRFSDFPDSPPVKGITTGISCMDDLIEVVPGTLTVFTGYANIGKSTVVDTVVANCIAHNIKSCIASFETMPKPILRDGIAKALIGCSDNDYDNHHQKAAAWKSVEDSVLVVSNALDEDMEFDLDEFLETVGVSIIRDGVKLVVLDPWNELEHKRNRDETATEYVGRAIRKIKSFIRRHNVAFWIVAHPTKPQKGTNSMPSLYDVSDSANWSNKADYGLVYHREDKTQNAGQLAVVKVRKGLPGKCDSRDVYFDHRKNRIAAKAA